MKHIKQQRVVNIPLVALWLHKQPQTPLLQVPFLRKLKQHAIYSCEIPLFDLKFGAKDITYFKTLSLLTSQR